MKPTAPEQYRVTPEKARNFRVPPSLVSTADYGRNGCFVLKRDGATMFCICSDQEGWEHVSVSLFEKRCPTWEEMCFVKETFWDDDETVIQYHPPKTEYVNMHPFCLHLWKPVASQIPLPPSILVGFKS